VTTASAHIDELPILMTSTTPLAGVAELYERHYEAVFRAALRVTGNPADAEDVLQTVFVRVLARGGDVEDIALPAAYFRCAAVNAAVDVLRRRASHRERCACRRKRRRVVRVPDRRQVAMTPRARALDSARARQAWTIAKIELRRAFFARRSFWVYGLALLPSVIFFGHGLEAKFRSDRLARHGLTAAALIDSIREGEPADDVKKRLGKPADERSFVRSRRVRRAGNAGTTTM
jgi:RNA polymerase sigma factor (sigma-70 family)